MLHLGLITFRIYDWENKKTSKFYGSWIYGPLGTLIYKFEYTELLQTYRGIVETFRKHCFRKYQISGNSFCNDLGKDGRRKMM